MSNIAGSIGTLAADGAKPSFPDADTGEPNSSEVLYVDFAAGEVLDPRIFLYEFAAPNDDDVPDVYQVHGPITLEEYDRQYLEKLQAESTTYVPLVTAGRLPDNNLNAEPILGGHTSAYYKTDPPAPQPLKPYEYY